MDLNGANDKDKSFYYDYGKQFYSEAHIIGEKGIDSAECVIFFRFSYSLMTFAKSTDVRNIGTSYTAYPNIFIDFRDSTGLIKKREKWTDTVSVNSYDSTKSKSNFYPGFIKVTLPRSISSINIEFRNDQLAALKRDKLNINLNKFVFGASISNPMLVSLGKTSNSSTSPVLEGSSVEYFEPFILGGNADLNSKNTVMVSYVKFRQGQEAFNYVIEYIPDKPDDVWGYIQPLSGQVRALPGSEPVFSVSGSNKLLFSFLLDKMPAIQDGFISGFLEIPLPAAFMYPGNYVMKVASATDPKDSLNYNFKVEWVDMPVSLRNADYAAEMMYYIMTDDEHDELSSGSKLEVLRKIWNFWKAKDPTKFTIYNEAMAEYFARVDYAFFNYKTLGEKDGAKTERGKVYILKDAPTQVKRRLEEDKTVEEWYYNNLKQVYVFETNHSGKYKLRKIENIVKK